jgi:hypothetical protein
VELLAGLAVPQHERGPLRADAHAPEVGGAKPAVCMTQGESGFTVLCDEYLIIIFGVRTCFRVLTSPASIPNVSAMNKALIWSDKVILR